MELWKCIHNLILYYNVDTFLLRLYGRFFYAKSEPIGGRSAKRIREYLLICHHQTIDVIFNINFFINVKYRRFFYALRGEKYVEVVEFG